MEYNEQGTFYHLFHAVFVSVFYAERQQPCASSCARPITTRTESAGTVDSPECSYQETARGTEGEICSSTTRKVYLFVS